MTEDLIKALVNELRQEIEDRIEAESAVATWKEKHREQVERRADAERELAKLRFKLPWGAKLHFPAEYREAGKARTMGMECRSAKMLVRHLRNVADEIDEWDKESGS